MLEVKLPKEWAGVIAGEHNQSFLYDVARFLHAEKSAGKVIYPPEHLLFSALQATSPQSVKIVVLGQDPYHGPGQAHGLSFSVLGGSEYHLRCVTFSRS